MKTKVKLLILTMALGAMTALSSCNDDGDDDFDPNVFCDEGLCANSSDLKDECIDFFNACMASEPDANNDECAAAALLICENI